MEPGTKVFIRYQARLAWITAWRYGGGIPLKSSFYIRKIQFAPVQGFLPFGFV
jgi:hypothetical protein